MPALPERTRVARALRPLNRTAPSPWRQELDEEATAVRAAEEGLWVPEWRPAPAHPFDVALVVDTSPSMAIWQHTAREFAELLRRQGAFRDVRHHRLDFGPRSPAELRLRLEGPAATAPWTRLPDPTGRRVVLVLTDGVGGAWRSGAAGHLLHRWGRVMPVAVVHVLAQRLWQWSALDARRARLSSPVPGAPNRLLRATATDLDTTTGTVVPVLALSAEWMANWARLMTTPGTVEATAVVAHPFGHEPPHEPPPPGDPAPRDRVLRFRTIASITAFRLAGLLAAAPLDLSSMTLVQRVLLPGSGLSTLAEVVLGDLLVRLPGEGGVEYDFHPGVREELLSGLHRADTARVARLLGERTTSTPVLRNYARAVDTPDEVGIPEATEDTAPYLRVQHAVFRALSGPYLARANRLAELGFGPRPREPAPRRHAPTGQRTAVLGPMPLRNNNFVGRAELLERVRRELAASGAVVLHGTGGVGKSQTAMEYLYRHAHEYQVVWWVPAEHPAQVRTSLVELARTLGVPGGSTGPAVDGVLQALADGEPHAPWLLVFDNADRPDDLRPFLPSGAGHVVITSRDPGWTEPARLVEVGPFTRRESVELLRALGGEIADAEADALGEALGDLPLAVEQAAAWRAQTGMDVAEYLALLAANRAALAGISEEDRLPIEAAWNVPLNLLAEQHPAALHLLRLCASFAADPIPQRLFRGVRGAPVPDEFVAAMEDPVAFRRVIREISRYGLAKVDHRTNTTQLHHLVQTVLSNSVDDEERERLRHTAHLLLAKDNPDDPYQPENWPRYAQLLPHAVESRASSFFDPLVRPLLNGLVRYLLAVGDFTAAVEVSEQTADAWRRAVGGADLDTLEMDRLHGVGLRRLGRVDEARSLNEATHAALKAHVGEEGHENLLKMEDTVAADCRRDGRFARELELRRGVLGKALRLFGANDPETLRYANNVASSLRGMGFFVEARELDRETVGYRETVLGPDDISTLRSLNALAMDLRECGEYREARKLLDDTLQRQRRLLGEDHPHTIGAMRSLAVTCCRAGDHERALELAEECLTRYRRRHGELHLDTVTSLMTVSVDLRHTGRPGVAREAAERSHRAFAGTSGDAHPFTLIAATNLAVVRRLSGDPAAAMALDRHAAVALRGIFDPDHPFALVASTNLASDLAALGRHAEAEELDRETVARSTRKLGGRHPSTLAVALNHALDLATLGDAHEARRLHLDTVEALREVLGPDHPATRSARDGLRANCDIDTMEL
ncbi:tetratricopeptide repeat protein [Saccharothrix sp. MB29]|nr:tetratricopeptide repeat protein [Saccharothrix sp. MB29]